MMFIGMIIQIRQRLKEQGEDLAAIPRAKGTNERILSKRMLLQKNHSGFYGLNELEEGQEWARMVAMGMEIKK